MKKSPVLGAKIKRDVSYEDFPDDSELLAPVYQTSPLNYDELRYIINELYPNYATNGDIQNEKRFLGKIDR